MRKNALVWLLLSICFSLNAQTITELLNKADQYEKQIKEEDAYNAYKEVLKADSRHLLSLIKCSELASRIGKRQLDKATSIDFYNAAKVYAQRALTVDSTSDEANCVMAIAMGRMALVSSGKEKVINVREIKRFADAALKYNPNSYKAWHILGKWNFEVNNLNIIEKAAIKLLYGGVPPASIENAIKFYEKAKMLEPSFILNLFELAKAYRKNNQDDKAVENINRLLKLPNKTAEDPIYKQEAKKMLAQLQ